MSGHATPQKSGAWLRLIDMRNAISISIFMTLISACAGTAKRPNGIPTNAVFSGGIKGGSWLDCQKIDKDFECAVYNYTGRLYEQGQFEFAAKIPKCYPAFIVSDYRINGGYMVPIKVSQISSKLKIVRTRENNSIETEIAQLFPGAKITIELDGDCKNGFYRAEIDGKIKSGRIWAGKFFQFTEK